MGNLTDDMTRLRGEIDALRNARGALMQDLAQGAKNLAGEVFAMRAGFAETQAAKTRMAKEERRAFLSGMFSTVSSLLSDFSSSHAAMARSDRTEREAFVADVKKTVASLLKNTAEDLEGARRVWCGLTAAEKRAAKQAEARRLNEEQVRQASAVKRQEEERRLAAEAAKQQAAERRKKDESRKPPEKKAITKPVSKGRKGKK